MKSTLIFKLMLTSLIAAVTALSGCASITREQCQTINPQAQGYSDGQNGIVTHNLDELLESCTSGKRAGSISDIAQFKNDYLKAYQKGLAEYCTPANGERIGLLGLSYDGACPREIETPFLKEYLYALKQYRDAHPQPTRVEPYFYGDQFFWGYDPFWMMHAPRPRLQPRHRH